MARRLLLVHAHPDDESITTGATMARYAAQGAAVTLLTYDDNGDYGHPDHVMAHRVATAAAECAADPGYGRGPFYALSNLLGRETDLFAGVA